MAAKLFKSASSKKINNFSFPFSINGKQPRSLINKRGLRTEVGEVTCIVEEDTFSCQYVIACPKEKKCAILDGAWEYNPVTSTLSDKSIRKIAKFIEEKKYQVEYCLETHVHADRVSSMNFWKVRQQLGFGVFHSFVDFLPYKRLIMEQKLALEKE